MASTYLTRTPSSAGNRKTFTFSCWFKRGKITSSYQRLFSCYSDTNNRDEIYLHEQDDTITIESVVSSSAIVNVKQIENLEILMVGIILYILLIQHKAQHQIE